MEAAVEETDKFARTPTAEFALTHTVRIPCMQQWQPAHLMGAHFMGHTREEPDMDLIWT